MFGPIIYVAFLSLLLNVLGWVASVALETDKLFDATGAASFLAALVLARATAPAAALTLRAALASAALALWAARLGAFLVARVAREPDRRLRRYVRDPAAFLGAFAAQSVWVFFGALPVVGLLSFGGAAPPLGASDAAALGAWAAAAGLAALADEQKRAFRADARNRGRFIAAGLWSWSRHPNYFFQIVASWALAVFCAPALLAGGGAAAAVAVAAPAVETLLLLYVSGVPLLEANANEKWGDDVKYRQYRENTPVLIPWPPRAGPGGGKRRS